MIVDYLCRNRTKLGKTSATPLREVLKDLTTEE